MGFDLITTFLFALVIFLLFYAYDGKTHLIDNRRRQIPETFTGDYEDYVMADIHTNPAVDDPFEVDNCDEVTAFTPRLPGAAAAAMGRRDATWNVVFNDYTVTEKELDALTRRDRKVGRYLPTTGGSFEHDNRIFE
jgi:hypothetical protein